MGTNIIVRTRHNIECAADRAMDWVGYSACVGDAVRTTIPFDRCCWHTVDPGTILFTGSVNRNIVCSGSWLAKYEYVVDDVNKWSYLARSGKIAGATGIDTGGDMKRSPRHRSHEAYGIGDELRVSLVSDGIYWGAAAFMRNTGEPCFTEGDVRTITELADPLAAGLRRAILSTHAAPAASNYGPGVVIFAESGETEMISPSAERWIAEMVEVPAPTQPAESKIVQAVAAGARAIEPGTDPLESPARSRVRTRSGMWLLLYGTRLSGEPSGRTAVIIQPAAPQDIAPVVALAHGFTQRECQIAMLCIQGRSTKDMAHSMSLSAYTVQDHLKSIFTKTRTRTRGELVGQVFLEHYAPRWEPIDEAPAGWWAKGIG